ncbi:MAG: hypothetical protein ACFCVC_14140 [Acidimicrobiia bacterium]
MDTLAPKQLRRRNPRRRRLAWSVLVLLMAAVGVGWMLAAAPGSGQALGSSWAPAPVEVAGGLSAVATIEGTQFAVHTEGGERTFLPGVNLGVTVPARYPGELALTADDYSRWFPMIAELGFRAVRVYTVHPPAFYAELERYNLAHPEHPLYLKHGIWPPEELMFETGDLWDEEVVAAFHFEIEQAVAAVHGELDSYHLRPEYGEYRADVSPWLVSWAIGAEWEPYVIDGSDRRNAGHVPYRGTRVSASPDATPTESWLANMFDHLAVLQAAHGRSVPFTFVNWPTTDPLPHPAEPNPATEDLVGIDANNIDTSEWPGGQFASYHAYPYYPDFLRHEYPDADDPYQAYLETLGDHHAGMPVIITEYGVSGGWAHAHDEPLGRTHGMHREPDQMATNAELLRVIEEAGMAGGLLFSWTDEWFKFTWNTLAYKHPADRRAMWHDVYTNETFFGVLAVEPGTDGPPVTIDGDDAEWAQGTILAGGGGIEETVGDLFGGAFAGLFDGDGVTKVEVTHDAAYLYLHLRTPEDWDAAPVSVVFATEEADGSLTPTTRVTMDAAAGGLLEWWWEFDPFLAHHGVRPTEYVPVAEDTEDWNPVRFLTARVQTAPWGEVFDSELLDVSTFERGSSDPESADHDSRAGWQASGQTIEMRIPWLALGFSDPSSLHRIAVADDGTVSGVAVTGLDIAVNHGSNGPHGGVYRWELWNSVEWHERTKVGVETLVTANLETAGP